MVDPLIRVSVAYRGCYQDVGRAELCFAGPNSACLMMHGQLTLQQLTSQDSASSQPSFTHYTSWSCSIQQVELHWLWLR